MVKMIGTRINQRQEHGRSGLLFFIMGINNDPACTSGDSTGSLRLYLILGGEGTKRAGSREGLPEPAITTPNRKLSSLCTLADSGEFFILSNRTLIFIKVTGFFLESSTVSLSIKESGRITVVFPNLFHIMFVHHKILKKVM